MTTEAHTTRRYVARLPIRSKPFAYSTSGTRPASLPSPLDPERDEPFEMPDPLLRELRLVETFSALPRPQPHLKRFVLRQRKRGVEGLGELCGGRCVEA